MARVRMIAIGLGLAACRPADAEPSATTPPPGWRALPAIGAAAAAAMKAEGVVVDAARAWGETAMGCYGVVLSLHGPGAGADMIEQVLGGLAADRTITTRDIVKPAADGVLSLSFERGHHRGQLRARVATGSMTVAACFANDRERAACERACTGFFTMAGSP